MKNLVLAGVLALACLAAGGAESLAHKFDPARDAAADLRVALASAQKDGKRVLVEVGGNWCPWCHVLERFIHDNQDVRDQLQSKYVVLRVNYSPANKNEALLSRWPQVSGYPHLFVLDESGRLVHSQGSAELEAGQDYDKAKMQAFLARFARQQ
jgi:thiol:disulfide interchange protein